MKKNRQGFTLIEIAIVMLVISIIATSFVTSYSVNSEIQKYNATNKKAKVIQDALTLFVAINGRLPCPASPIQASSNGTFGLEKITLSANGSQAAVCNTTNTGILSANLSSSSSGDVIYYGAIPVRSLGLSDEFMLDGFGNKLGYVVQRAFANSVDTNTKCLYGSEAMDDNTQQKYMCYRAQASGSVNALTTDLAVTTASTGGTSLSKDAVYVLISHGANGYGAFTKYADANVDGGSTASVNNVLRLQNPPVSNTDELANLGCNALGVCGSIPTTYVSRAKSKYFDDLVFFKNRNQVVLECNKYLSTYCTDKHKIYVK